MRFTSSARFPVRQPISRTRDADSSSPCLPFAGSTPTRRVKIRSEAANPARELTNPDQGH